MTAKLFIGGRGHRRAPIAVTGLLIVALFSAFLGLFRDKASAASDEGSATGLGPLRGLLPTDHLTLDSAIRVNLSNETVRLPLYPGDAPVPGHPGETEQVWYILQDASDAGLAQDLGVNFAPKLANIGIGCPACVQTVTEDNPTPQQNPFGTALINFQGAPNFSPTRTRCLARTASRCKRFSAGRRGRPRLQPVHPDRRLACRVQRPDHGNREWSVRCRPPHQHC